MYVNELIEEVLPGRLTSFSQDFFSNTVTTLDSDGIETIKEVGPRRVRETVTADYNNFPNHLEGYTLESFVHGTATYTREFDSLYDETHYKELNEAIC